MINEEMTGAADILIDARGHRCPVPTLRLRRSMETAPAGSVIRLLADDPMARIDVPHFVEGAGARLIAVDEVPDGGLQFTVGTPAGPAG